MHLIIDYKTNNQVSGKIISYQSIDNIVYSDKGITICYRGKFNKPAHPIFLDYTKISHCLNKHDFMNTFILNFSQNQPNVIIYNKDM